MASRRNTTRATLVEGERSHHCAISAAESVFEKHTFVKHNQAISINPHSVYDSLREKMKKKLIFVKRHGDIFTSVAGRNDTQSG